MRDHLLALRDRSQIVRLVPAEELIEQSKQSFRPVSVEYDVQCTRTRDQLDLFQRWRHCGNSERDLFSLKHAAGEIGTARARVVGLRSGNGYLAYPTQKSLQISAFCEAVLSGDGAGQIGEQDKRRDSGGEEVCLRHGLMLLAGVYNDIVRAFGWPNT